MRASRSQPRGCRTTTRTPAWGADVVGVAVGGGIPLVDTLHGAAPHADVLLVGAIDGYANIHGPNERVLTDELKKATVAEADFFARFAAL